MDRRQSEQHAAQTLARAALSWLRYRGHLGALAPVLWGTGHLLAPLSPGAYKYPLGSPSARYTEFRVVFHSML